jgi:hypothetical protein
VVVVVVVVVVLGVVGVVVVVVVAVAAIPVGRMNAGYPTISWIYLFDSHDTQ